MEEIQYGRFFEVEWHTDLNKPGGGVILKEGLAFQLVC
jgi:hypothetical protein